MIGRAARSAFFVLLPAFGVGGALGLPVLICLAGAASLRPSLLRQVVEKRPVTLLLLIALLGLSAVSSLWSEHAAGVQALKLAILAPLALLFAMSAALDQRLTRAGGVAACLVLAVLLGIEAVGEMPLNGAAQPGAEPAELLRNVSRGAVLLLALIWGAAGALMAMRGRAWRGLGLVILAMGGFISLQFGQFANTVAFAAGLSAFFAAFIAPRATLALVAGGLLVWLIAAPFATPLIASALDPATLPYSWNDRVRIWDFISSRIAEQPWFGHGLDAARAHTETVPVHPHSASLQLWFETGLIGVGLASVLLITSARWMLGAFGDNRPAAAAAAGTLAATGVIANLSYNLWAEWWMATLFIAAGLVGALGGAHR